jgi:lysozyme family protein
LAQEVLGTLLLVEGGLVNDPQDPGGITHFGVSLRFALGCNDLGVDGHPMLDIDGDGAVTRADILKLTPEAAKDLYYLEFWMPLRCDALPPALAVAVLDAGVNQGRGPAVTMLQEILGVTQDGKIGPITLNRAQSRKPAETLDRYIARRAFRYATTRNFSRYGRGWMNRLIGNHSYAIRHLPPAS